MRDDKDRKTDSSDSGLAWNDFDSNRLAFLGLVADKANVIARLVAEANVNAADTDEYFHRLIKIAYDGNILSAAQLGEFGRRDPTTASRWINGHSTPDSFAQEAILKRIAAEATAQAVQLRSDYKRTDAPRRKVRS
jgi:hypothetical protein